MTGGLKPGYPNTYDEARRVVHGNTSKAVELIRDMQAEAAAALVRAEVDILSLARLLLIALPHVPSNTPDYRTSPRREIDGYPSDYGNPAPLWYSVAETLRRAFPEKILVTHRWPRTQYGPQEHMYCHLASLGDGDVWYTVLVDSLDELPSHKWQAEGKGSPQMRAARGDFDIKKEAGR